MNVSRKQNVSTFLSELDVSLTLLAVSIKVTVYRKLATFMETEQ